MSKHHFWAQFLRSFTNVRTVYQSIHTDHTHLSVQERTTQVNVRRSEAIHTHNPSYAQFTRNQTNVIRRAEAIHVENHALSQIGSRFLEARVAALEAQLAQLLAQLPG